MKQRTRGIPSSHSGVARFCGSRGVFSRPALPAPIAAQVPKRAVTAPVEETRTSNLRDARQALRRRGDRRRAHRASRPREQDGRRRR